MPEAENVRSYESALHIATRSVPTAAPADRAADIRGSLLGRRFEGATDIAVAVAVSLLAACSISTLVAMSLPWMLFRFGIDPAFGSGPLATVIQDLLSVAVYLGLSTALVS